MQPVHIIIAIGLGKNGGSRNGKIFAITFYNGRMRQFPVFLKAVSVDEQMLRTQLQPVDSTMHGEKRGVQDVYLINFLRRDNSHRPRQSLFFYNFTQGIPLLFGKLFGVVQQFVLEVFGQDNGGSINRLPQRQPRPASSQPASISSLFK